MALESGYYQARTERLVTHWNSADADGDGDIVTREEVDGQGNILGRMDVKDAMGRIVHSYLPPKGFENLPSFDGTPNYVRRDDRGRVKRAPNGDAIGIVEGTTLVEYPDGSYELIRDDYNRRLFQLAHDKVEAPAERSLNTGSVTTGQLSSTDMEAFRAWQAEKAAVAETEKADA